MYLVQLLLPLYSNQGDAFPKAMFLQVRRELTERFGGLTAYTRAPVKGLWQEDGETVSDDLVIYEVMTEPLDHEWWQEYRRQLEQYFQQEKLVVRAQSICIL